MRWTCRKTDVRWTRAGGAIAVCAVVLAPTASTAEEGAAATPPVSASPTTAVPYWQAPPLPTALIQGGAIPPGWQPQAVPYQGIGPDGQPVTMYFAPTYVFTYQAGPPALATPVVKPGSPVARVAPTAASPTGGWNYSTSGAPPVTPTLPAGGVTRYRSAYRLPPDARGLTGTPLVPPGPLAEPAALPAQAWASAPVAQPAAQPPLAAPPTQWAAASPQQPAVEPFVAAAAAGTAAAVAADPPVASMPPPVAPVLEPLPPQPGLDGAPSQAPRAFAAKNWRVVGVYDGDTLTCLDENGQQQKVRLAGIDAPESGQTHAQESRDALAALVFGRTVELIENGRDSSGRWIAQVSVNGRDVAGEMVATGNAWCSPSSTDAALTAAQSSAQTAKLGIWAEANPTAPWEYASGK